LLPTDSSPKAFNRWVEPKLRIAPSPDIPRPSHELLLFSISRCDILDNAQCFPAWLREVFATNLRRIRNARGLSQDDLAYDAGISRSYLSQLEKGVFYASLKIMEKLALALEVEPAEFLKQHKAAGKTR
jgi:DNA-binding XRE family transcriptional regulator